MIAEEPDTGGIRLITELPLPLTPSPSNPTSDEVLIGIVYARDLG